MIQAEQAAFKEHMKQLFPACSEKWKLCYPNAKLHRINKATSQTDFKISLRWFFLEKPVGLCFHKEQDNSTERDMSTQAYGNYFPRVKIHQKRSGFEA